MQVTDIGPLAGHDRLHVLDLRRNVITDVAPLARLPDLDTLCLAQNRIVDPAPVGTIPTSLVLDVFGNQVTDVSGLDETNGTLLTGVDGCAPPVCPSTASPDRHA